MNITKLKKSIILLVAMVMAVALLAGCGGDKTSDGTQDVSAPTPDPDALLSMDQVDRALLLYDQLNTAMDSVDSFYEKNTIVITVDAMGQEQVTTQQGDATCYGILGDNFALVFKGEVAQDNETTAISMGYINGSSFSQMGDVKIYSNMTAQEYIDYEEEIGKPLNDAIEPSKDKCSQITSDKDENGNWVITFKGYPVDAAMAAFDQLMGSSAYAYKSYIGSVSLELRYVVDAETYYALGQQIIIDTTPVSGAELGFKIDYLSEYSNHDAIASAPTMNLDGFTQIDDIRIIDKIDSGLMEISKVEQGKYTLDTSTNVTGDFEYYIHEVDHGTYGYNQDGLYNFDIDFEYEINYGDGLIPNNTGRLTFDGAKYRQQSSALPEDMEQFITETEAKIIVAGQLLTLTVSSSDVLDLTVTELEDGGYKVKITCGGQLLEEAEYMLYSLSGVEWSTTSSDITMTVIMDADYNITSISKSVNLDAKYVIYTVNLQQSISVDFTE